MSTFKIIGLAGGAGTGKDTLASRYFQPHGFFPVALADEIKLNVLQSGLARFEELFHQPKPDHVRKLIQEEGTERGFKVHGERHWCNKLAQKLPYYHWRWNVNFVIPDVRFPHECDWIHELGGVVYKVEAPERYKNNGMSATNRAHISERALDGRDELFDAFIQNDYTDEFVVGTQILAVLRAHKLLPPVKAVSPLASQTIKSGAQPVIMYMDESPLNISTTGKITQAVMEELRRAALMSPNITSTNK